jgi:hypothetical protein
MNIEKGIFTIPATMTPFAHGRPLRSGFLAEPLRWLTQCLAKALATDPALFANLFELDHYRMHVLALGLAHHDGEPTPALVKSLTAERPKEALYPIIGQGPQGLGRLCKPCLRKPCLRQSVIAL